MAIERTSEGPLFDPFSPDVIADPYPHYARLRASDPLHRSPLGFFVASRHAEVTAILRDRRFGKDFVGRVTRGHGDAIMAEPAYRSMRHWILHLDPPDHTRLRGLMVQAFSARRIEAMRPRIEAIVERSIDRIAPARQADLVADFALRLPVTVICDMLGVPPAHQEVFVSRHAAHHGKADHMADRAIFDRIVGAREQGSPVALSRAELDAANAGNLANAAYFEQLIALRRRQPGDDLATSLVEAEEDGSKLSNEELVANIILLFGAGHETTVNQLGNAVLTLARHPDQLEALRADPRLLPGAIEEILRYEPSVQVATRTALEDVAVGPTLIPQGESVLCLLGSANRDPAVYRDPDRFDIARADVRPSTFGGGIHYCLGAQLARIELEVAISTLMRRLPALRPNDAERPDWRRTFAQRGPRTLVASW
jgi:cytochrome P450